MDDFSIHYSTDGNIYYGGHHVKGRVLLTVNKPVQAKELTCRILGKYELALSDKADKEETVYLNTVWTSIPKPGRRLVQGTHEFPFSKLLDDELPGSIEGAKGFIRYVVKATLTYTDDNGGDETTLTALRGFTLIERNNLTSLPQDWFDPITRQLTKKFGMFRCTGGNVRLTLLIAGSAYVPGENVPITGRLENRSMCRVDKVAAILRLKREYKGAGGVNCSDYFDVLEEALALYVDGNTANAITINRNLALPALNPSTPVPIATANGTQHADGRRQSLFTRISSAGRIGQRHIVATYELVIRITFENAIMNSPVETTVPITIGTEPRAISRLSRLGAMMAKQQSQPNKKGSPLYRQPRAEKYVSLKQPNERYVCTPTDLNHTNRYPFFADLPTSSKQSQKISRIVRVLRAEKALRRGVQHPIAASPHALPLTPPPTANDYGRPVGLTIRPNTVLRF